MLQQLLLTATEIPLSGQVGHPFNCNDVSFRLSDLGPFIMRKGWKERKKYQTLKNNIENQIKINHLFPTVERTVNISPYQDGYSRVHFAFQAPIRTLTKKLLMWIATNSKCNFQLNIL
ncbi:hypothetical protein AVEN_57317-1 [Araneus ventricosus]|uniref:Uncharacterized protein n=1 Tax=Araneus ventricosus TaxID=182803 RepID=A0A4Y2SRJ1_ARAVE|nr:hypothetical protein AVEN_57317-1 [Araneus ventricosus]